MNLIKNMVKEYLRLSFAGLFLLGPCILMTTADQFNFSIPLLWLFFLIAIALLTIPIFYLPRTLNLSPIDILLWVNVLFVIIRNSLSLYSLNEHLFSLIGLTLFYSIIRFSIAEDLNTYRKYSLFIILSLFAIPIVFQILIGYLQFFNYHTPYNSNFNISGSFFNPGPYAIYLAAALCFICPILFYLENRFIKILTLLLCLSGLGIIFISESRTSYLGFLCGFLYLCCTHKTLLSYLKRRTLSKNWAKIILSSLLLIILPVLIFSIYNFKKKSADGRVLVWQVSATMIKKNPIFGIGYGKFQNEYSGYQQAYFQDNMNRTEEFKMLADHVIYAFNEYIELLVERGAFGFLLFISLLFTILFCRLNESQNCSIMSVVLFYGAKSGMICILVSAMFSYPFSIVSIQVLFYFYAAIITSLSSRSMLSAINLKDIDWKIKIPLTLISIIVGVTILLSTYNRFHAFRDLIRLDSLGTINDYEKLLPTLGDVSDFRMDYARALEKEGKHRLANKQFEIIFEASKSINNYYILGNSYYQLKEYSKAERLYIEAAATFPGLIKPHYLLSLLYHTTNDLDKFNKSAELVKNFKPKIDNYEVYEIKQQTINLQKQSINKRLIRFTK